MVYVKKIVRPIVVRPNILFCTRGIGDVDFESKINLFSLIAIGSLLLWMFTLFILLHQLGVY